MHFVSTTYTIPLLDMDTGEVTKAEKAGYILLDDETGASVGLGYHLAMAAPPSLDVVSRVTHLPSGYEFGIHFLSEGDAQRFILGIVPLFDWTQGIRALYDAFPSLRPGLRDALSQAIGGQSQYDKKIVRKPRDSYQKLREMARQYALQ